MNRSVRKEIKELKLVIVDSTNPLSVTAAYENSIEQLRFLRTSGFIDGSEHLRYFRIFSATCSKKLKSLRDIKSC